MGAAGAVTGGVQGANSLITGVVSYMASKKNAKFIDKQADVIEVEERRAGGRVLDSQRVAFAKSGVDPTTGSALDVQSIDAGEVELRARRAAFPLRQEALNEKLRGSQALVSGVVGALSMGIAKPTFAATGISGSQNLAPVQRVARS
jgi:hypothetical protein